MRAKVDTAIIAIAGGSGSGKTWLARQLRRRFAPYASILSLDDFYRDLSLVPSAERAQVNFDSPDAIEWPLFEKVLIAIRRGGSVLVPRYDFAIHTRAEGLRRWLPRPIVLVEGLWPWWQPGLARHYTLKVFRVDPEDIRLARRTKRDTRQRGRTGESVVMQWHDQVQPMYAKFVHPQLEAADLMFGPRPTAAQIDKLADQILVRIHSCAA